MSEPAAFPRGSKRRPQSDKKEKDAKKDSKRKRENDDFLFGKKTNADRDKDGSSKKKKKKKRTTLDGEEGTASSMLPLGGGYVVGQKKNLLIEALSFQKLGKGTKLLGTVREVLDDYALVSLPNLLTGYVLKNDKDEFSLRSMLRVGQVLAVCVTKTASETVGKGPFQVNRRRIQVSVSPAHMNAISEKNSTAPFWRGQVSSVEDHGVVVDLGQGRKGFCKFDNIEGDYTLDDDPQEDEEGEDDDNQDEKNSTDKHYLHEGRVLDFVLQDTKAAVWSLALPSAENAAKRSLPSSYHPPLSALNPGDLVQCKVEALARNGLCVAFLGNVFRGAIHVNHLGGQWIPKIRQESDEWKSVFTEVKQMAARIIAVDPKTKMVRLTIQPHLLQLCPPSPSLQPPVGAVFEDATVVRLEHGVGALLALPPTSDWTPDTSKTTVMSKKLAKMENYMKGVKVPLAHVHISKAVNHGKRISEGDFAKEYAPSTTHKVRITSTTHWTEGVASAASAPEVVDAHVLTYNDLETGKVYRDVRVAALLDAGSIIVDFGLGVRGLLSTLQQFDKAVTSDYRTKLRKEKYAVDRKIDVRVLTVNPKTKKCFVTAKKSIVTSKDEPVCSYDQLKVGVTATGYISRIDDRALYVTFCNRVYGRVTARSLAAELGIENHKENYRVGDVVRACVVTRRKRIGDAYVYPNDEDEETSEQETSPLKTYWDVILSLQAEQDAVLPDEAPSQNLELKSGAVLPPKSMKVVEMVKSKSRARGSGFIPGHAIVRIKSSQFGMDSDNALDYIECKLPFDHLADSYDDSQIASMEALDEYAATLLAVGKKVKRAGIILVDPKKPKIEYASGIGMMPLVSIRPSFVEAHQKPVQGETETADVLMPSSTTNMYMGASVRGYVVRLDPQHGAFIRFLDNVTGLIPKLKNGLKLRLYETIICRVVALDVMATPPRILLQVGASGKPKATVDSISLKPGDVVDSAKVVNVNFLRASLRIGGLDGESPTKVRARLHVTLADTKALNLKKPVRNKSATAAESIGKGHPFYKWKPGKKLKDLKCVSVEEMKGVLFVELATQDVGQSAFVETASDLKAGSKVAAIVKGYGKSNSGLWVQVSPSVTGFIPALELSLNAKHLNQLMSYYPMGCRLDCCVLGKDSWKAEWRKKRPPSLQSEDERSRKGKDSQIAFLSVLRASEGDEKSARTKPSRGELLVGKVNRRIPSFLGPALMLEIRGGYMARCCITELEEPDDWVNLPLGREIRPFVSPQQQNVVTDEEDDDEPTSDGNGNDEDGSSSEEGEDDSDSDSDEDDEEAAPRSNDNFPNGKYVQCRVLKPVPGRKLVEVSLRQSRIEGDLEEDQPPQKKDLVQGYVVQTNKKGCFVRLSHSLEGRVVIKELSDGFLPDPAASFPSGRLVAGRVKHILKMKKKGTRKTFLDLDMRESTLLDKQDKLQFTDVKIGSKHKATVTRIEEYGVFVRIENSEVSGLVHKSECSDKYVKNLDALYDPGDLVKVLVIKKDTETKKMGFSMKASHFEDDEDSDDDSEIEEEEESDEESVEMDEDEEESSDDDSSANGVDLDSDDENYVSKLAAKMKDGQDASGSDDNDVDMEDATDDDTDDDDDDSSDSDGEDDEKPSQTAMDTDVGFNWGAGTTTTASTRDEDSSDDDDDDETDDDEDDDDVVKSKSHSSRKKAAARRREEQDIFKRERALADGTADENPETAADFERLLASEPNRSELWIRYMAYHLSLADLESARRIAQRAFDRMDFSQEGEKLNVWTALLTMELKFGNTKDAFEGTLEKACQHNNPKKVHLRVCEILAKEVQNTSSSSEAVARADAMFAKMCKKFRSKKKVWIAHLTYLLQQEGRSQEAHDLLKRALKSLPEYKHVETMSKFAQLEFEHGTTERGRTIFDGILAKHPKRLDLLFVYVDKEVKAGAVEAARKLFGKTVDFQTNQARTKKHKLSDKQMKSLFKKWFRIEEAHGTEDTQEDVKDAARAFVNKQGN